MNSRTLPAPRETWEIMKSYLMWPLYARKNNTPHPSICLRGHWDPTANLIDKDMSGDEDGNQTAVKDMTTVEDLMCDLM